MVEHRFCLDNYFFTLPSNTSSRVLQKVLVEDDLFVPGANDSVILRDTLRLYGSIFAVCFLLFCGLRLKFRRTYNIRTWVEGINCDLAARADQLGFLSWFWKLRATDEEIREQCGMDAVCLLRTFYFGMKLCGIGMINSIWLFPIYWTSEGSDETGHIQDAVAKASVSFVPPASFRLLSTVAGTYIVFGFTMYFILEEYKWFASHRHAYLSERVPRNYTVYVAGLPERLRGDEKLADFFRFVFSHDTVLAAHVHLEIPNLEKKVNSRKALVLHLEHLINIEKVKGKTPKTSDGKNSISIAVQELEVLNQEISHGIEALKNREKSQRELGLANNDQDDGSSSKQSETESPLDGRKDRGGVLQFVSAGIETGIDIVSAGKEFVLGVEEDGSHREAGFVAFTKLSSRQAALQMLHHRSPYSVDVFEAPDPENIYYRNVGKSHKELQVGLILSVSVTFVLRLLWTVPTAFIASLGNLESLSKSWPFLQKLIEKYPWVVEFFALLAPFLLICFNAILPTLLGLITLLELPLSQSAQIAQQFPKLASFMIIQTFFVSAISGSLWAELTNIIQSTARVIDLLATALPGQSTYFVQILLVKTFVGLSLELLKVMPLYKSVVRRCVGPNLTESESSRRVLGFIRPLNRPLWLLHAEVYAANVLYFMVFFCYSSTAPLVNWFLLFCFLLMYPSWRYQIFCNYPTKPDTGGMMWIKFMSIVRLAAIIGQLTLWAVLALKRFPYAIPLMLPLLGINGLFNVYMELRHRQIAEFLPSEDCVKTDQKANMDHLDFSFLLDQYKQPALMAEEAQLPINLTAAEMQQRLCIARAKPAVDGQQQNSESLTA